MRNDRANPLFAIRNNDFLSIWEASNLGFLSAFDDSAVRLKC